MTRWLTKKTFYVHYKNTANSAWWRRDTSRCDYAAELGNTISVRFGSNPYDERTGNQKRLRYNGVAQFYREWYSDFFLNTSYPMAMARFEDVIFRPEVAVRQICECVGGRPLQEFSYRHETVNLGPGHGHHGNSGLLTSFVKYGKPLEEYYEMFSRQDKRIMKFVFRNDDGFLEAMGYKQFLD